MARLVDRYDFRGSSQFITTGSYVFRELSLACFPRFVICYLFVYGVNFMLIEITALRLNSKILSQAIVIFPLALLTCSLMARFVFFSQQGVEQ